MCCCVCVCVCHCTGSMQRQHGHILQHLQQYLHPSNGVDISSITQDSRSRHKYEWQLDCKQPHHTRQLTADAVSKSIHRHDTGQQHSYTLPPCLHCWMCTPHPYPTALPLQLLSSIRYPSQWEFLLYSTMQEQFPMIELQPEVELLPGHGRIDLYLPQYGIAVMVDGEQHFQHKNAGHHDNSSKQQAGTDMAFGAAVLLGEGSVRGMLRLHHLDACSWGMYIKHAVHVAVGNPACRFSLYTHSYKLFDIIL